MHPKDSGTFFEIKYRLTTDTHRSKAHRNQYNLQKIINLRNADEITKQNIFYGLLGAWDL